MAKELTPEEKRAKRNEYARAYYAKNKDRMKAAKGKGKGAKPVAKKAAAAKKPAKSAPKVSFGAAAPAVAPAGGAQ